MKVYVVLLNTKSLDHSSGQIDEFNDIVKIFSSPEKANDFLEGKPRSKTMLGRWFSIESYEVA